MGESDVLVFMVSPRAVEERCQALWRDFKSPSQILAALVAMENLLALAPPGDREGPAYRCIRSAIARHAEVARGELLGECEGRLAAALLHREMREITRVHGILSRKSFWQAGASASRRLEYASQLDALSWLEGWVESSRAKAASGYPDSLNFRAAGIDVAEFAAMEELLHCLRSV